MIKDIVIIGSGGLAKEVALLIEEVNKKEEVWNFLGFIDKDEKKIVLLNPFSVLNMIQANKVNLYDTLPFAETGNAFRGIDV